MFINHTNHPSQYWSDTQLDAGRQYGVIMDMPFPRIDPMASSAEISQLAQEYAARIIALHPTAVLCQGEFIYCCSPSGLPLWQPPVNGWSRNPMGMG